MPSHGHRSGRRSRSQKRPAIIGRDIPVLPKTQPKHVLADEEIEFIRSKLEAGLTDPEVCRMFFRHYHRDLPASSPHYYRRLMEREQHGE